MRDNLLAIAVLALVLWMGATHVEAAPPPATPPLDPATHYRVGIAREDVTPDYPVRLNGFGFRREESTGITQRLWAKAVAIQHGEAPPVVLVTLDNLGIRQTMIDAILAKLPGQVPLPRPNLVVTFTHTHTAPKLNGACDTIFSSPIPPQHQAHIDRYTDELTAALTRVVQHALSDLQNATLSWGQGRATFAQNRRTPGGPVDHSLPILVVRDLRGELRAVVTTYACHCVTLSHNEISGDWAGYAQEALERALPGVTAMVSIGFGSDSNPSSGVTGDKVAIAAEQGGEIAKEVVRLLQGPLQPVTGPIATTCRQISLPLQKLPTVEELRELARQDNAIGYNAKFQLDRLARQASLVDSLDYPVQTWSFGDSLAMVFLAGEVCVDYAIELRKEFDATRLWLHGYANDFCAYIPSERLLREGGYGGGAEIVYFALPAMLAPGVEKRILDEVRQQIPPCFAAATPVTGTRGSQPQAPEVSRAHIRVPDRFRVELVAAEPLVVDPVAIDFAEDGSLWVCEMNDYPRALDGSTAPSGKIVRLTDEDHDGQYDHRSVFWNGIPFPSGITVWGKGVLLCSAPYVYYAEDTNGDGVSDVRTPLLQGFAETNDHARINGFRLGLDHWLHGANGLISGQVQVLPNGPQLDIAGRDFRFIPFTSHLGPLSGLTQYGRVRDDWCNWFGCENLVLAEHYPLAEEFVTPSQHLPLPPSVHHLEPTDAAHRLHPIGDTVRFQLSGGLGEVTSACGIEVYRDNWLGDDLYGNLFTCEPVNQLVHRMTTRPQDLTFEGLRDPSEADREFLASDDQWFRPVQARTGPDGGLWIVDMYRYLIEHPRWIPEEVVRELNITAGNDRGRIYRIVRPDKAKRSWPIFDDPAQIVEQLDSPNGTARDMIHRHFLIHQKELASNPAIHQALQRVARQGKWPAARAQALCILEALRGLTPKDCTAALADAHPGVRYQALRLWAQLTPGPNRDVAVLKPLLKDNDLRVRWQLAFHLKELRPVETKAAALATLAGTTDNSTYLQHAILSSLDGESLAPFVSAFLESAPQHQIDIRPWLEPLGQLSVVDHVPASFQRIILAQAPIDPQMPPSLATLELIARLLPLDPAWVIGQLPPLQTGAPNGGWLTQARTIATDTEAATELRIAALGLLGQLADAANDDVASLQTLMSPQTPSPIIAAAIQALLRMDSPSAASTLFEAWGSFTPEMRRDALATLLERKPFWQPLSEALRHGTIVASQLDAATRQQLFQHPDLQLRETFQELEGAAQESDRQAVVNRYVQAVSQTGDPQRGREHFRKTCSPCHRLAGEGYEVGPDLASLTYRSVSGLAQAIFDPNRAVEERYQVYQAVRTDGRLASGILKETTAQTIRLLGQNAQLSEIRRDDLDVLASSGLSLMPVGLEKDLTPEQFADLIAYLLERAPTPKSFPGNQPATIEPDEKGQLNLSAQAAEIYGDQIRFEAPDNNIGYWHAESDEVAWTIKIATARSYEVRMEWACTDNSAGNQFVCEGLGAPIQGEVESTGGFDKYQTVLLGTRYLTAGEHRVIVRPAKPLIRTNLMDLRGLKLTPAP